MNEIAQINEQIAKVLVEKHETWMAACRSYDEGRYLSGRALHSRYNRQNSEYLRLVAKRNSLLLYSHHDDRTLPQDSRVGERARVGKVQAQGELQNGAGGSQRR